MMMGAAVAMRAGTTVVLGVGVVVIRKEAVEATVAVVQAVPFLAVVSGVATALVGLGPALRGPWKPAEGAMLLVVGREAEGDRLMI